MQNNTINNILNDSYVRDYLKYIVFFFKRLGFILSNCGLKNGSSVLVKGFLMFLHVLVGKLCISLYFSLLVNKLSV